MKKIALLFTNYGPYHLARIRAFHEYAHSKEWEVIGLELSRSSTTYAWKTDTIGFPCSIISVRKKKEELSSVFQRLHLLSQLHTKLSELSPDVLAIAGYAEPAMLAALLWSKCHHKQVVLMSESKEDDAPRRWIQEYLKAFLMKGYQSALVGGKPHKRYLEKLGMSSDKIFFGYDVVDNSVFHPSQIGDSSSPLERPYFLAVNRFVPKKNLLFLISAYAAYRQAAPNNEVWDLILCGDGALRSEIEQSVKDLSLTAHVHLPGFLQQDEMLPYFAHADCFIHASIQEQWGLVINEAMAAGLPVLVSERCGCYEELVLDGITGFGFNPKILQELKELMLKVSSGAIDIQKMREASLEHIEKFSLSYFSQGLGQAVNCSLNLV